MTKLKIIAGNCILESLETSIDTAKFLIDMSKKYNFELIYKSSFKKDNRSDIKYYTGLGLEESIRIFKYLKKKLDVKIITDFHNLYELDTEIVDVIDILQLPAYLCMQTELTLGLANKQKPINIKKGQFLSPQDTSNIIKKIESVGNMNIIITERGTSFGYHDIIVDPRSIYELKRFNYPVIFDAGHSVRIYGIPSNETRGGNKEYILPLSKAMIGAGADGIFVEVHPNPSMAKCDSATQLSFEEFEILIEKILPIWRALHG